MSFFISVLGDPRVNQNPALLAIGILFYRWHNVQASLVQAIHPTWADEDVFQGRKRRIEFDKIVKLCEYLISTIWAKLYFVCCKRTI
jgi:hypothetical protein